MKEKEMFPGIIEYLKSEGYNIVETHPGRQRGPDVVAEKAGRELIIEMKGDTAALDVDLGTAIWQLLRYMKDETKDFALALTPSYLRYVEAVKLPLRRLNIRVFIVSGKEVRIL